jgi:hypothetical protein
MDVHKETIVVAVTAIGEVGKATAYGTFPNTAAALETLVKRLRSWQRTDQILLRSRSLRLRRSPRPHQDGRRLHSGRAIHDSAQKR